MTTETSFHGIDLTKDGRVERRTMLDRRAPKVDTPVAQPQPVVEEAPAKPELIESAPIEKTARKTKTRDHRDLRNIRESIKGQETKKPLKKK